VSNETKAALKKLRRSTNRWREMPMERSVTEILEDLGKFLQDGARDGSIRFYPPQPGDGRGLVPPEVAEALERDIREEAERLGLIQPQSKKRNRRPKDRGPEQLSFWQ
jgi:hypothetical protein